MRNETELRTHRCCFTGHRPEKLTRSEQAIKSDLKKEIKLAIKAGYTVYLTGMARGTDLWAAQIVLELQQRNNDIKLICAVPYEGFDERWPRLWKQLYWQVLDKADYVQVIGQGYYPGIFQIRNQWMADRSSRVIAVYNGQSGGTKNTIDYAKIQGLPIRIIRG